MESHTDLPISEVPHTSNNLQAQIGNQTEQVESELNTPCVNTPDEMIEFSTPPQSTTDDVSDGIEELTVREIDNESQ